MAILAHFQRGRKITTLGIVRGPCGPPSPPVADQGQGPWFSGPHSDATGDSWRADLRRTALAPRHQLLSCESSPELSCCDRDRRPAGCGLPFDPLLCLRSHCVSLSDPPLRGTSSQCSLEGKPRRTKGAVGRLGLILLGWQLGGVILSTAVVWGFAAIAGLLLHLVASRFWTLVPLVALLLALHGVILALLSFVMIALHCILIISLYRERNQVLGVTCAEPGEHNPRSSGRAAASVALAVLEDGVLASLAVFVVLCVSVFRQFGTPGDRRRDGSQGLFLGRPGEQPDAPFARPSRLVQITPRSTSRRRPTARSS